MTAQPTVDVHSRQFQGCLFLTGPTASGKTAAGIELARRLDAEIVSMDSMALYSGMDIGTAKPTLAERLLAPHHLIDVVSPYEDYSVARYVSDAASVVREIESRGRRALFVGGTPLYLKSLLRGIFAGPEADWAIRRRLLQQAHDQGEAALHARLAEVDPQSAARLHPRDVRRVVRALEVFELTGQPISAWQQQTASPADASPRVFVLDLPRPVLHERINRRVDAMFEQGLVAEVERLLAGGALSHTASQAVGYREVIEHLDGKLDLEATIELVKLRTRQFAKRQMTWFRSLEECQLVPLAEPFAAGAAVEEILARIAATDTTH